MPPLRAIRKCAAHSWARPALALVIGLQAGAPAGAQCFSSAPVPGFFEEAVGGEVTGSARVEAGLIEVCSLSRGYGGTTDSLHGLVQEAGDEFELSVEVAGIEGEGQAGVEARVFRGTGSDPAQAVVRISVEGDPARGGFALLSSVRPEKSAAMEAMGTVPVEAQLPVRIGIERAGDRITTFYLGGQGRVDHLSVQVPPDSPLDAAAYRVGMVHGSDVSEEQQPGSGIGRFHDPRLARESSVRPPRLSRAVENYQATVDQAAVLTIRGTGLSSALEVTVAGRRAAIRERRDDRLTVEIEPTGIPVRGDVVVATPTGTAEIPGAFFSFGKSFVRCDCNGDGGVDVSDMVKMLTLIFARGTPCECEEAGDCNDDGELDVSDAVRGLLFLFLHRGGGLPPPYPEPGTDPAAPMCGLEEQLPAITGISQARIAEGDVFSITGAGFSEATRVVIPGARLEVVQREPDRITLRAGVVTAGGAAAVRLIADFGPPTSSLCRPATCATTSIGPLSRLDEPVVLVPSPVAGAVVSTQAGPRAPIVLQLDRQVFDPTRPLEVIANLDAPPIANVSPGGRATSFQVGPEATFEHCIVALAERLYHELGAGGHLGEVDVLPEPELGQVVIAPAEGFPLASAVGGQIAVHLGSIGRCGPDGTHPVADERAHGWCRFEELVEPCNGLPQFEWFIPVSRVRSKASSLGGLPHPAARSPHEKEIMFNWEAYCHIRRHRLWNLCALERLVERGRTDIPDFPVGAWVTKTLWRTAEEIPAAVNKDNLYNYVYLGDGKTYYLTAIHHITKDIDRWFWYDLYPSQMALEGGKGEFARGIGGCGGTSVDAPAWVGATVWRYYDLCTNVTRSQPLSTSGAGGVGPTATENSAWCGNFEFATECPDAIDAANLVPVNDCFSGDSTCLKCHEDGSVASVGGATLGMDFLHSLKSAAPEPDPCRPGEEGGPVTWVDTIGPFTSNHCHCHSNWMEYATLVNAPSGPVPTMFRVKPFDPANSFLWRKVTNTHLGLCATDAACGVAMPKGSYPLTDSELDRIEAWIVGGALYE